MKRLTLLFVVTLALAGCTTNPIAPLARSDVTPAATASVTEESASLPTGPQAPAINNQTWLNTDQALSQADLNGKVVLIDFWTFG